MAPILLNGICLDVWDTNLRQSPSAILGDFHKQVAAVFYLLHPLVLNSVWCFGGIGPWTLPVKQSFRLWVLLYNLCSSFMVRFEVQLVYGHSLVQK